VIRKSTKGFPECPRIPAPTCRVNERGAGLAAADRRSEDFPQLAIDWERRPSRADSHAVISKVDVLHVEGDQLGKKHWQPAESTIRQRECRWGGRQESQRLRDPAD